MKAAIFYNAKTNPSNRYFVQQVASVLDHAKITYIVNPSPQIWKTIDVALAIGGDGTVLYTANILSKTRLPILGINFGHRGYLCELDKENFSQGIDRLLRNDCSVIERTRLQARIRKSDGTMHTLEALNEISIGGINRTVSIMADIITPGKKIDTRISGDGLIVSTETGSTAYNINAGGPMLLTDAFVILANNAFFDSHDLLPITKSLVVPTATKIRINDQSHNPGNFPFVIADGQNSIRLKKNDAVTISRAKAKNYFIKF